MKQNILKQAADYSKRRRKEVRRYRVIGVLAAFVVFCTTYALIMPAITMEHPQCGLEEHTHAKACYEDVLVCGLEESEDVGHVHTDACYEVTTEEVLTCTQEVGGHQHTDACYTKETVTKYKTITVEDTETVMEETTEMVSVDDYETQVVGQDEEGNDITQSVKVGSHEEPRTVSRPVTKVIGSHEERVEDGTEEVFTLTCGEDVSGHQHGDSCYQTVEHRTLICTEPEGTPGHHHTEACYEHKLICTIPEHTHTDECYPEKNGDQSVIEGDQSVIEGEGEQPELPTVDSEGYVIDADGNRVANEDGTYTQYQVGEDGALVLDEDGNPIPAEAAEEITEPEMIALPEGAEIPEGYDKQYDCIAPDGTFAVVVHAPEGALPEGAQLVAEVLPDESIETEDGGVVAMDIRFELNGEKVEPTSSVYVVINALGLLPEDADPESVAIQHHKDIEGETDTQTAVAVAAQVAGLIDESAIMTADEEPAEAPAEEPAPVELPENVEIVADSTPDTGIVELDDTASVTAAFELESFSTFTITYSRTGLTVKVVDEDGNDISGGPNKNLTLTSYPNITSGVKISELVANTEGLSSFTVGDWEYSFLQAKVSNSEVKWIKYTTSYSNSKWQYSTRDNPSSNGWSNFNYNDLKFVYSKQFVGDTSGFVDDGLAYNSGSDGEGNGLYQTGWNSDAPSKYVWYDTGIVKTNGGYTHTDKHVQSVSLTPADYTGNTGGLDPAQYEIALGDATLGNREQTASDTTTQLGKHFPDAKQAEEPYEEYRECTKSEATYVKVSGRFYEEGSATWNTITGNSDYDEIPGVYYRRWVSPDYYDYAMLKVTPENGYYVTRITVACLNADFSIWGFDSNPTAFDCARYNSHTALTSTFNVSDMKADRSVELKVRSDAFSHSDDEACSGKGFYILVETAPVPSPLFVKYDVGEIGGVNAAQVLGFSTDEGVWLDKTVGRRTDTKTAVWGLDHSYTVDKIEKTGKDENGNPDWALGDLNYYPTDVTSAVDTQAAAKNYAFAGWKVEYYDDDLTNVTASGNALESIDFTERSSSTDTKIRQPNEKVPLVTNAKLVAQWKTVPVAEVTKVIQNVDKAENPSGVKSFEFTLTANPNNEVKPTTFTVDTMRYVDENGSKGFVSRTESCTFDDNLTAKFNLDMSGNTRYTCWINSLPDGEYTLEETTTAGATVSYSTKTFTVAKDADGKQIVQKITVTNDFAPKPVAFDINLEKVTPKTNGYKGNPDSAANPDGLWNTLGGATFGIYEPESELDEFDKLGTEGYTQKAIAILSPAVAGGGTAHDGTKDGKLEYGKTYKLAELNAPPGYNKLDHVIYFTVQTDGTFELKTVNDTAITENDEYVSGKLVTSADSTVLNLIVANYGGYVLPSTGGAGTLMYTLGGGMLMMACALVLVYKKTLRKGAREI